MFSINWWVRDCFVRERPERGSEASGAGGTRVNRASRGPLFRRIWGDLENRMIQHPGIRRQSVQIVSTVSDVCCTNDFSSSPLMTFLCKREKKKKFDSGSYTCIKWRVWIKHWRKNIKDWSVQHMIYALGFSTVIKINLQIAYCYKHIDL